jgi:hypothetical protein
MTSNASKYNVEELQDFMVALAGRYTTIAAHVPLCEQLWNDPQHRLWLVAALMRKVSSLLEEPDEASADFLASKAHADLGLDQTQEGPTSTQIAEVLSAVILQMPDEIWSEPSTLWNSLLSTLREEFGLTASIATVEHEPAPPDSKANALAAIFANAIGREWTPSSERQFETWRKEPEFSWLVALRQTAQLDALLQEARRTSSAPTPFENPQLLHQLAAMSLFDRRLFVSMQDSRRRTPAWADPVIDEASGTIRWRFTIPLPQTAELQVTAGNEALGTLLASRSPDGSVSIKTGSGAFRTLPTVLSAPLRPVRAAAVAEPPRVPLGSNLTGCFQVTRDAMIIELEWQQEKVE